LNDAGLIPKTIALSVQLPDVNLEEFGGESLPLSFYRPLPNPHN